MRRSTDWAAMGFEETLATWTDLNARSKFWGDDHRAGFKNWEEIADPRNPLGERQGIDERIMLRELLRRIDMMVILENKLDCLVRLHTPWAPGVIGGAHQPCPSVAPIDRAVDPRFALVAWSAAASERGRLLRWRRWHGRPRAPRAVGL